MIPRGTWLAADRSLPAIPGVSVRGRENVWVVNLYRPRGGGEVGRQRFVMGKCEMTPDYVLGGFTRKVGLRIGWGDEGCVWRRGREGVLRDTLFGAAKDGAENGNEELPALV
jgi:hypothetical protein